MTNKKPRKRSHSIRYFLAIIGTLVFGWKVVTGFHDMNLSHEGLLCVGEQLGPGFYEHWAQNRKWKKKNRWNNAAFSYIKTHVDYKKQALTLESLEQQCSEYISVWKVWKAITPTMNNGPGIGEDLIVVNNWGRSNFGPTMREINPAISDERIRSMLFWAAFVLFCIVDIRRLNKIFIWSRDDG